MPGNQSHAPQMGLPMGASRGASAPPSTSTFRTGHRRSRSTSTPTTNATDSQEHFEDARSSIHRVREESVANQPNVSIAEDMLDDDLDFLPPLETFFNMVRRSVSKVKTVKTNARRLKTSFLHCYQSKESSVVYFACEATLCKSTDVNLTICPLFTCISMPFRMSV